MTLLQNIIMSMFDVASVIIISKKLTSSPIKLSYGLIAWILTSLFGGVLGYFLDEILSISLNILTLCIMLILIYRKKIIEIIYIYIFTMIIIMSVQLLIVLLMSTINSQFQYDFMNGMIAQSILIAIVVFIYCKIPLFSIYDFIRSKNNIFNVIILNMFVLCFSILIYWYLDFNGIFENIILITIATAIILIINLVILKNGLRNTYQEKELGIYKRYNPIIQELIEELRGKQHEFDNHLQALKLMLADDNLNENIDTIKNYIKDLEIKNDLGNLIKLDNKILASLLYSKKKKSEEKGTILNIEIKNYMMQFKNYELVEIIGTLIDNALETKVDKNIVYLKIHKENDMNVIEVKNKHPYLSQNVILNMFKKGFSTKSGNRGYGFFNLKNIVNAAKGTIEVSNLKDEIDEENYVAIKIRIN